MPETTCAVPFCSKSGRHMFPKDKKRRDAWVQAIRRGKTTYQKWSPKKHSCICENHFTKDDYHNSAYTYSGVEQQKRALRKTAVPSVFSWTCTETLQKNQAREERNGLRASRKRKLFEDISSSVINTDEEPEFVAQKLYIVLDELNVGACESVIEMDVDTSDVVQDGPSEPSVPVKVDVEVQTTKMPAYSIDNFEKDDKAVHFYTGLENYMKFFFVLSTLGPAAYHLNYIYHSVVSVSVPDQFLLVLMKLRRHKTNFELSRMFNVSESVVTNIFITWILFMAKQWRELHIWPSSELVKFFAPSSFWRNYPNTRVIIDGTECPIKKPNNPIAQQATFSTYKNRNTVKVLVGISPGGLVSYVSPSYGGSTSDRQIVERSALTKICSKTDSIMADKGFNVQDIFAPFDVHINIPTFFKNKNRMSGESVIRDRKISSKRVHVERIIGLGKTYRILTEPMTASETKLSSEIIFVCFMLCNFRNSIVSTYA